MSILLDPKQYSTLLHVTKTSDYYMETFDLKDYRFKTIGCSCCSIDMDLSKAELIELFKSLIKALHIELAEIKKDG